MKDGMLEKMVYAAGYDGISDFCKKTKVAVSFETARRAITENRYSTWSLFLILRALGTSRKDIKKILTQTGDTHLAPLLEDVTIEEVDLARISLHRKMAATTDAGFEMVVSAFAYVAENSGIDVLKELEEIRNSRLRTKIESEG